MIFKFDPEMFSELRQKQFYDPCILASIIANKILEEHLSKCPRVIGNPANGAWQTQSSPAAGRTHEALLFNIAKIKGIES